MAERAEWHVAGKSAAVVRKFAATIQAVAMLGKGGTMSLVGLPPGAFELDIFSTA